MKKTPPATELPTDYRFDVAEAARSAQRLFETEPDARLAVTLSEIGSAGVEAESEIYLRADEAAALLLTVSPDQRLNAGARQFFVLRVGRAQLLPPPPARPGDNQDTNRPIGDSQATEWD